MEKSVKKKVVKDLQDKFGEARAAFIADYRGITANDMAEFRRSLRDNSNEFKVVRNTLAKRALDGTPAEPLTEHFVGTTAIVFSYSDAVSAAKTLTDFSKEKPFKLKGALLGEKVLSLDEVKALADLPSREELLAKMVGSMNSPLTGLVGVLSGVPRKLVYALNAVKAQKEGAA